MTQMDDAPQLMGVLACQKKCPGTRVLLGDARDLSVFGSNMFKLVHGRRIGSGEDTSNAWWLHYVAREA